MNKRKKGLVYGLTILTVFAIFVAFAPPTLALPIANDFGVNDTGGYQGTYVLAPVNITNAQNGPIISVRFDILYNNSVINIVDVQKGDLTSQWETPSYFNHGWGTRISIVYDGETTHAIQNGATGSVVVLNFSVIGGAGETSRMNFTDIQLSDTGYNVGTAPAKNGTFTLLVYGLIEGRITNITGTEMEGVTVNLTSLDSSVVKTTTTNETGYYSFTNVEIGNYYVNVSKPGFWKNSTMMAVESGEIKTVYMILWRKGDLNNNGISADAGDLAMMKDASTGKITADWKYDLNTNSMFADAGDLAMMKDASVGKIELL